MNELLDEFYPIVFCFQPATAGSGFSPLSPDIIDMNKYPDYAKVPWHYATIYPGDCVYIPAGMYALIVVLWIVQYENSAVRAIVMVDGATLDVKAILFRRKAEIKELLGNSHALL